MATTTSHDATEQDSATTDASPTPSAQKDVPGPVPNRSLDRRMFLRGTAAAGATAVGLGSGHMTGESEAIGISLAVGGAALFAAGAAAGVGIQSWRVDGDTELDPDDVLQNQIYQAASAVSQGRDEFVNQLQQEYLNPTDPQNTPYGRVAWQEVRVAAVREITNGNSESAALAAAKDALDKQTTRSVVNIVERYNTGMNAMIEQMVAHENNGLSSISSGSSNYSLSLLDLSAETNASMVSAGQTDAATTSQSLLWEWTIPNLPVPASNLDGRESELKMLVSGIDISGTTYKVKPIAWGNGFLNKSTGDDSSGSYYVTDTDLADVEWLSVGTYEEIIDRIHTAYNEITTDLSTYVSTLYDGIQQGAIDPADILGPQEIIDQFSDSDEMTRLATELVAIGADVPDSEAAGYEATVSHPDIQADELTGLVFPQFSVDPAPSISPGTTIAASDYDLRTSAMSLS
ncbi:hypothetical protein ACFQH2_14030 [Natronoarchaeum sp. GCM10025703]|uniref:hypothetical protein n=1 Tax=Natronoarchaeum sp. GCM10025703 TaxID=3252685 RepID=UPI00360C2A35